MHNIYIVTVEKSHITTGTIKVFTFSAEEAVDIVYERISVGDLQPCSDEIQWDDTRYDEGSLSTTGEVNKAV